jgi:hypothetical protein
VWATAAALPIVLAVLLRGVPSVERALGAAPGPLLDRLHRGRRERAAAEILHAVP